MTAAPDTGAGDDALPAVADLALTRAGERWTPFRRAIYSELARAGRPMSAYAVAKALEREQRRAVAANAVDPVLRLFEGCGIVDRIEMAKAYAIVPNPTAKASYLCLLCHRCRRATLVEHGGMASRLMALARSMGFSPRRTIIEAAGICATCSDPASSVEEGEGAYDRRSR